MEDYTNPTCYATQFFAGFTTLHRRFWVVVVGSERRKLREPNGYGSNSNSWSFQGHSCQVSPSNHGNPERALPWGIPTTKALRLKPPCRSEISP